MKSSLLHSHKSKYEHQRYKNKVESNQKSKKLMEKLESEYRQEALAKSLNAENKGFQLFKKMLNSSKISSAADKNIDELVAKRQPIELELKIGRQGLGFKSKKQKIDVPKHERLDNIEMNENKFLQVKIEKSQLYYNKKDYFQLQKICKNLDSQNNIDEPIEEWYWPKKFKENNCEEKSDSEEKDEFDFKERLHVLDEYIRSNYFYCLWCGYKFDNNDDIKQNCPGNSRQLH